MQAHTEWMESHQVSLYLAAIALGAALGLIAPGLAHSAELAIHPVLALLLYATFLGIPFGRIGRSFRDWRFLAAILAVNFLAAPVLAYLLSRIVAHDQVLLVGVLFVLLTPCIDYVIVFSGLAGGNKERLLVATPLLMVVQMLLLPLYLWAFVGAEFVESIEFSPFVEAFVLIIAIPLAAAGLTQLATSRSRLGVKVQAVAAEAMVPLMVLTLAVVVVSQIAGVGAKLGSLLLTVPVYALFAAIMVPVGVCVARISHLDVPATRSIVFSGVTRNSLVVLPLVLALPSKFDLAPLVVVTQTLVELVVMVTFVRLIPQVVPAVGNQAITGADDSGAPASGNDE